MKTIKYIKFNNTDLPIMIDGLMDQINYFV